MNDKSSRGYLIRLEKARFENEEKNNRVYWNPRGSLIKQTSHYSNNLTINTANTNSNKLFVKNIKTEEDKIINKNNSLILNNKKSEGSLEKNKVNSYNLYDTKKTLKLELLNLECLTVPSESDQE